MKAKTVLVPLLLPVTIATADQVKESGVVPICTETFCVDKIHVFFDGIRPEFVQAFAQYSCHLHGVNVVSLDVDQLRTADDFDLPQVLVVFLRDINRLTELHPTLQPPAGANEVSDFSRRVDVNRGGSTHSVHYAVFNLSKSPCSELGCLLGNTMRYLSSVTGDEFPVDTDQFGDGSYCAQ